MSNGKGSKPRPYSVSQEEFANNWDNIFKKKYTVQVQETPDGEQFIEFPPKLLDQVGWVEGDEIKWTKTKEGYILKKKK